jgi:uncharacterized protein
VKPVPSPSAITAPYWDAARDGRLLLRRCTECGVVAHPPRPLCPACWAAAFEWVESSGRGRVVSATTVHHPPSPAFATPYVLAIVRLEEGPRMMTNIVTDDPSRVRIDMPVRVTFEERGDFRIPQFVPVDD